MNEELKNTKEIMSEIDSSSFHTLSHADLDLITLVTSIKNVLIGKGVLTLEEIMHQKEQDSLEIFQAYQATQKATNRDVIRTKDFYEQVEWIKGVMNDIRENQRRGDVL